jgi:hypothetical protein
MKRFYQYSLLLVLFAALGCAHGPKKPTPGQRRRLEKHALMHYRLGIDAYTNSRYAEAIFQWKETLKYQPDFPNVKDYIERAKRADKTLKSIKSEPEPLPNSATVESQ